MEDQAQRICSEPQPEPLHPWHLLSAAPQCLHHNHMLHQQPPQLLLWEQYLRHLQWRLHLLQHRLLQARYHLHLSSK